MNKFLKIGVISAIATSALSAQAVTFAFQTEGNYTETVGGSLTTAEGGSTYRSGHDANLTVTSVDYNIVELAPGAALSQIWGGSGTIKGLYQGNAYQLDFQVGTGGVFRKDGLTNKRSFAGDILTFTITGSALDGYTGEGIFGGTLLGSKDIFEGLSKTSFDLDAEPVPEPASMAALGLGLAGIAARRKRK